jgi:assimilatory nitrate reductase catalytic subunit
MVEGASADAVRPWILAPVATPPRGTLSRGRIVCNCLDVAEREIQTAIAKGADLGTLQATLKCGTECGSCVAEIRRMCGASSSAEKAA